MEILGVTLQQQEKCSKVPQMRWGAKPAVEFVIFIRPLATFINMPEDVVLSIGDGVIDVDEDDWLGSGLHIN